MHRLITGTILFAVLAAMPAAAQDTDSLKARTTSVAAFKNGTGFFIREGTATLREGWAFWDYIPPAALGTFWVGSPKVGVSIERLLALREDSSRTVPARTVADMLEANVGKQVKITYGERVIEGKLLAVPVDTDSSPGQPIPFNVVSTVPRPASDLVLVETANGTVAVSKASISLVEFAGKANADHVVKDKVKRLRFKISGAKESAPITIGYLQKGISWSPAYLVELLNDTSARITMQGLLVNDAEDVEGAEVFFVVGFPNFLYSDVVSPLALTQSISEFIDRLGRPQSPAGGYGTVMTQSVMYNRADYGYAGGGPESAPDFGYSSTSETPGAQEEDLFLYKMQDVSLKKGERAYYTVFSAEVPFKHVYKWTVNDTSGVRTDGYVDSNRNSGTPPAEDQVWHMLTLTNTSKYPWTTAPGMAMSQGQPLAQDTLAYTPKGGENDLKLTVATDIRGKKSELETERQNDAININGHSFTKVTSEGKLTLKSFKSKAVTVHVKKTIIGEVTSTTLGGKTEKMGVAIRAVNPTSVVKWDVALKPGEEKVLDYSYYTYVRY